MDKLLRTLKIIMSSEVIAYKELLALSVQKKDVLIENKTDDLNDIVSKEQSILAKIKQHERSRKDCAAKISTECGYSDSNIDIETIIDIADGSLKKDIIAIRAELKQIITALTDINENNKMLIDTHRKYVSFCMEAITGQMSTLNTYSHAGVENNQETANMLIDSTI